MNRLYFVIGGLLLVLAFGLASFYWQLQTLERSTFQELRAVNGLKSQQLEHWLQERQADAIVLTDNPLFIDLVAKSFNDPLAQERLKQRLKLFLDAKPYKQITLFLPDGQMSLNVGQHFSYLPTRTHELFPLAVERAKPILTDIFVDKHGHRHLDLIAPIGLDGNQTDSIAFLVFHINPSHFIDPLMTSWPSSMASAQTLLIRFDNNRIYAQTPIRSSASVSQSTQPLEGFERLIVMKEMGLTEGHMSCQNQQGQAVWLYCNTLDAMPWSLLSFVEKKIIVQPLLWRSFLQALLFGLVVVFFLSWLYRRLKEKQRSLLEDLKVAAAVFDHTGEGIMLTNSRGEIQMVNQAFLRILGYQESEVVGKTPGLLRSGRHTEDFYRQMWQDLKESGNWQGEIWNRKQNGDLVAEWLSISSLADDSGNITHYIGVFADISKLKDSERQLDYMSHHDPLTNLANRQLLIIHLHQALSRYVKPPQRGEHLAVLAIDIDRFKNINDSYGQSLGDEVLKLIASLLQKGRRKTDMVSRIRGNTFVLVLDELQQPEDAARIASAIIAELANPLHLSNGIEISLSATVGISMLQNPALSAEELLQQADTALYQAKHEGRGGFLFFDMGMTYKAQERLVMEAQLKQALLQNQFEVYYQPQVNLASGHIESAEALVRWRHPEIGLVSPAHFIPICEEIGLITRLGDWVMRNVLEQGAMWLAAGYPGRVLAVNVAASQWQQPDFVDKVKDLLMETGYPAELLELELTESVLIRQEQETVNAMQKLRNMGVRIALDDFGTGYSSLVYLHNLPLSKLKIDKQFIDNILDDSKKQQLSKAIIELAHNLGFDVIAEGVEQPDQLAWLKKYGCDSYQGYLCSPPLAADAFIKLNHCQAHDLS